ncbi:hypothetical protein ACFQU2_23305 [Siccirubricoccus deserti]
MAEQQHYEFSAVEAKEILAERERGWEGFTHSSPGASSSRRWC